MADTPQKKPERKRPRGIDHLLTEGAELLRSGQVESACSRATEALMLRPGNPLAQNLLALGLIQRGQVPKAREILEKLIRRNPDVVPLRLNAGLAALLADDMHTALEHLRHAVDLDPGHTRAFGYLGLVHLRTGEGGLAKAALHEAGLSALSDQIGASDDPRQTALLAGELLTAVDGLPPGDGAAEPHEGFVETAPLTRPALRARATQPEIEIAASPEETEEETEAPEEETDVPEETEAPEETEEDKALDALEEPEGTEETEEDKALDALEETEETEASEETEETEETREPAQLDEPEVQDKQDEPDPRAITAPELPALHLQETEAGTEPAPVPAAAPALAQIETETERELEALVPGRHAGGALRRLDLHARTPRVELWERGLVLRINDTSGPALVRRDLALLEHGDLSWTPVNRRRKGADQDPFVVGDRPISRAEGQGLLVLCPRSRGQLCLLELDNEAIFAREEDLVAGIGQLHWENGRIPEAGADGPALVNLRGDGALALCSPRGGPIWSAALDEAAGSLTVALAGVVAWSQDVVPQQVERLDGELRIRFSGTGNVWMQVPALDADAG
jgi:tetratricopeptide (TPR) repeat protein